MGEVHHEIEEVFQKILPARSLQQKLAGGEYYHVCPPCYLDSTVTGATQMASDAVLQITDGKVKELFGNYFNNHMITFYAENLSVKEQPEFVRIVNHVVKPMLKIVDLFKEGR